MGDGLIVNSLNKEESAMDDLECDVRTILADGGDPFGAIMMAVSQLVVGQRLRLIASFRPEPLYKVMASKGFASSSIPLDDGNWQVVFSPLPVSNPADPETWPDPADYLDCSEFDPKDAPSSVLSALALRHEGEVLFALFAGEPLPLYAALKAHGHAWVGDFDEAGEAYRLMIRTGRV
jgi:uncharacterized protein (DUF2249 family)